MTEQVRYGKIILPNGDVLCEGYDAEQLDELIDGWKNNAEAIGSDLYDMTGDLAIGPQIMTDLLNRVKELEAKFGS